jgi:preprotein translocase subunit SecD
LLVFAAATAWALAPHGKNDLRAHLKPRAHRDKVRGSLGLYGVDDRAGDAVAAAAKSLPPSTRLEIENGPVGPGKSVAMNYVRAWADDGESLRDARSRLLRWTEDVGAAALPKGDHFAIGEYGRGDDGDLERQVRTYVLTGGPVLTEENVVDARVSVDRKPARTTVIVMVELDPSGAAAFEEWTGSHVQERFAIVSNDEVVSAPVIQSRIGGGQFQITMGSFEESKALAQAKELAAALGGDPDSDQE